MKDDVYIRGKNPMTKMEVRGTIISYLELASAQSVLEIGAGTGSVTVEIAKSAPSANVIAIEKTITGCELILENASRHNVNIEVVNDHAPTEQLLEPSQFDRIYVGGTGRAFTEIMAWLEAGMMQAGCILVFSVITLESMNEILSYVLKSEKYSELEASQIQASRLENLGEYHYFKPLNPCTVIKFVYK